MEPRPSPRDHIPEVMRYLDKYAAREKQLRRLGREADRLRRAEFNAPVVPLERAFQRGWVKTYTLADRIERRPDAQIFRTILATVNRSVWARERSFVHHRTRQPLVLRPRVIPFREMEKLGWPASHRRLFVLGTWRVVFEDIATRHDWARYCWGRSVHGFKVVDTWWLREDVQPHLITHQRVDLPEVKSRLAEIDAFMRRTGGWEMLSRLHGHTDWWRFYYPLRRELRAAEHFLEDRRGATD